MKDTATIRVEYTCHGCGIQWRAVEVRERWPSEDVVTWAKFAAQECGNDHARRSPLCMKGEVDLKIPLAPGNARVGAAPRH